MSLPPAELARRLAAASAATGVRVTLPPVAAAVREADPCRWRGVRAPRPGSNKDWRRCDSPRRAELRLAEVACPCDGCGPGCKGYEGD